MKAGTMAPITMLWAYLLAGTAALAQPTPAAGTVERPRSVLEGVTALDKPVTLADTKIPLGELVLKVAEATGVRLTTVRDMADEPVAVVVQDLPARELLLQLAELLDYQWRREGKEGARRYEIYQDVAARQREEALRQAQLRAVEQRLREQMALYVELASLPEVKFQSVIEAARKHQEEQQKLTPEQRQALLVSPEAKARDRRFNAAQQLASSTNRAIARLIGRLTPEQWTALRREGWINFCTDPQPGEQRLPADTERVFRGFRADPYVPGTSFPVGDPRRETILQQEEEVREQWRAATGYRVTVRLDANRLETGGALWLTANAFPLRDGKPVDPLPHDGGEWKQVFLYAGPEDLPQRQDQAAEQTPERRAALEQDTLVGVKRRFQPTIKARPKQLESGSTAVRFRELLPDLARTYSVQFISDAYWSTSPRVDHPSAVGETAALFSLLDRWVTSTHRWEHRDRVIRLRSRTWFFDRPREVPLRLVRHWKQIAEQRSPLPLDEYVSMATTLSDGQLNSMETIEEEAGLPAGSLQSTNVHYARHALRLYGSLTPGQRQAADRGKALPVAEMAPGQRSLFLTGIREIERRWYQPIPLDLAQWTKGGFSVGNERMTVRTAIQEGGAPITVLEPAGGPGEPVPMGGRGGGATGRPVNRVKFQFDYGEERRKTVDVMVAPDP